LPADNSLAEPGIVPPRHLRATCQRNHEKKRPPTRSSRNAANQQHELGFSAPAHTCVARVRRRGLKICMRGRRKVPVCVGIIGPSAAPRFDWRAAGRALSLDLEKPFTTLCRHWFMSCASGTALVSAAGQPRHTGKAGAKRRPRFLASDFHTAGSRHVASRCQAPDSMSSSQTIQETPGVLGAA